MLTPGVFVRALPPIPESLKKQDKTAQRKRD